MTDLNKGNLCCDFCTVPGVGKAKDKKMNYHGLDRIYELFGIFDAYYRYMYRFGDNTWMCN